MSACRQTGENLPILLSPSHDSSNGVPHSEWVSWGFFIVTNTKPILDKTVYDAQARLTLQAAAPSKTAKPGQFNIRGPADLCQIVSPQVIFVSERGK